MLQLAQGGCPQGFLHGIEPEPVALSGGHCQAGAIDGNGGTNGDSGHRILGEGNNECGQPGMGFRGLHGGYTLNNAGKHGFTS